MHTQSTTLATFLEEDFTNVMTPGQSLTNEGDESMIDIVKIANSL